MLVTWVALRWLTLSTQSLSKRCCSSFWCELIAGNKIAGMLLCFRLEKLYKLLQFLVGKALWALILWQIYPSISFFSLFSFCPPTLIIHPSSGSAEEILEVPWRTIWGNCVKKSLCRMRSDALRTATLQYPQAAKTQMYGVISPWHYLYWWKEINLNCMKLK